MKKERLMCSLLTAAALCLFSGFSMTASADADRWSSTTTRQADGTIAIDFAEVQVTLPGDWAGKCQMGTSEDYVSFYHTGSRKLYTEELGYANGGLLFTICFSEELDFLDLPSYQGLGQVADGYYYVTFPTDVQGYMNDASTMAEFQDLYDDMTWVAEHILITAAEYAPILEAEFSDSYIFPTSSSAYLTTEDLYGMTASEVQMAINEIYARHHRKFVLKEVQEYFDSKSWYEGYIEAEDFDVSVMNPYEGANINLMVEYMKTAPTS